MEIDPKGIKECEVFLLVPGILGAKVFSKQIFRVNADIFKPIPALWDAPSVKVSGM